MVSVDLARAKEEQQIQYAIDRYTNEAKRIYGVIDERVGEVPYLRVNTQ